MNFRNKLLLAVAGMLALTGASQGHAQSLPQFDVASIKVSSPKFGPYGAIRVNPTGIDCSGVVLIQLIGEAYQVPFSGISGSDSRTRDSLQGTYYDIAAKTDHTVTKDQLRLMLQTLLADRFKLTLHHESKTQPVYKLTVGKNGSKLQELTADTEGMPYMTPLFENSSTARASSPALSDDLKAASAQTPIGTGFRNYTMARFTAVLSNYMDRPVLDLTGLKGIYDFDLKLSGVIPPDKSTGGVNPSWASSSIFSDIQKELGLQLAKDTGPVNYLVVDHVEKPSEN